MLKLPPCFLDFGARVLHYLANLRLFGRRQLEHPIHPLERPFSGEAKQIVPVRERGRREADCETGGERDRDRRYVEFTLQGRPGG